MMIKCVAIKTKTKIYSLPKPNRHCDVIRLIIKEERNYDHDSIQGFLTNDDEFVDRKKALEIAFESGQITKSISSQLYSEDLW